MFYQSELTSIFSDDKSLELEGSGCLCAAAEKLENQFGSLKSVFERLPCYVGDRVDRKSI